MKVARMISQKAFDVDADGLHWIGFNFDSSQGVTILEECFATRHLRNKKGESAKLEHGNDAY